MDESFGPEYVRPAQKDCPRCACCTVDLCDRGRDSIMQCAGLTPAEHKGTVRGCPCSAVTTPRTAAWRAAQVRVTLLARELPVSEQAEDVLRALADSREVDTDDGGLLPQLTARGLAELQGLRPVITELGRTYLAARGDVRSRAVVEVVDVDRRARTARVTVAAWRPDEPVTVLLDQITSDTGLDADMLPGRLLEAEANTEAPTADRLVLTGLRAGGDGRTGARQ
ncbi:hypothetical protein [Streptomyces sioyaensis]|uniref:hypothetical protein n=1 Tax=Streptomyces sioyaensis TaxID=67364 RepID=UPI003D74B108